MFEFIGYLGKYICRRYYFIFVIILLVRIRVLVFGGSVNGYSYLESNLVVFRKS